MPMQPWEQKFEFIYFAICAVVAVAGAIGTVGFPNPIRGALSLLFTIIAIAGIYLQLHAPFLAAIQLIVYAGAVVVLFLFVIMLIGPASNPSHDGKGIVSRVAGAIAASAIMLQVGWVLSQKLVPRMPPVQAGFGSVESFGALLFSDYLVPFEVASVLLMVAIVGAVAVARGKQPDPQQQPRSLEATRDRAAAAKASS
jgi:NADH-quinone oxidoreductase subunit J